MPKIKQINGDHVSHVCQSYIVTCHLLKEILSRSIMETSGYLAKVYIITRLRVRYVFDEVQESVRSY